MAFVVEDGTGLADSNSYLTVEELDAYWADVGVQLTIEGASAPELLAAKQAACVASTRYVELRWADRFRGYRANCLDQSLAWPRLCAYDNEGHLLEGVPRLLKFGVAEYARRVFDGNALTPVPTGQDATGLVITSTKRKAGPLEVVTAYMPSRPESWVPLPAGDHYLRQLVYDFGGAARA